MRGITRALLVVVGLVVVSASASAIPKLWTLSGGTFTDGGTVSGSFVYDANTNTYSNINITTTAGSVITTPSTMTFFSNGVTPTSLQVLVNASNNADLTGTRAMAFFFSSALDNLGGTRTLTGEEGTCGNAGCTFPIAPIRPINAGSVSAPVISVPTLSPRMIGLLVLALAGAGLFLVRKL